MLEASHQSINWCQARQFFCELIVMSVGSGLMVTNRSCCQKLLYWGREHGRDCEFYWLWQTSCRHDCDLTLIQSRVMEVSSLSINVYSPQNNYVVDWSTKVPKRPAGQSGILQPKTGQKCVTTLPNTSYIIRLLSLSSWY